MGLNTRKKLKLLFSKHSTKTFYLFVKHTLQTSISSVFLGIYCIKMQPDGKTEGTAFMIRNSKCYENGKYQREFFQAITFVKNGIILLFLLYPSCRHKK